MTNQKPSTKAYETHLFEALEIAQVPSTKAYTAVQEVRNMAGENIDAKFDAVNSKFDAVNSKFDAVNSSINSLRWMTGGLLIPIFIGHHRSFAEELTPFAQPPPL